MLSQHSKPHPVLAPSVAVVLVMALSALATYGDSDESDSEPEVATDKVATLLQTKQEVRRLVPVVSGGRKSDGSKQPVRIALPTVDKRGVRQCYIRKRPCHGRRNVSLIMQEESDEEDTPVPKRVKVLCGCFLCIALIQCMARLELFQHCACNLVCLVALGVC